MQHPHFNQKATMIDPQGRTVQTLTLKDPEEIKKAIRESHDSETPTDDLLRLCVIPLLMDVRNILFAAFQVFLPFQGVGNTVVALLAQVRDNTGSNKIHIPR
jgi:hypothetical protein